MTRREFFLGSLFQNRTTSIAVEVIEFFSGSKGPSALLVHHTSEATRNGFSEWLRAHDGAPISCRLPDGTNVSAQIFRVKMCFGRGLILTPLPVAIRPKDVVKIIAG